MKAGSELIKISASGDDRHYWYSVRDIMTLLINARKGRLSYSNYWWHPY